MASSTIKFDIPATYMRGFDLAQQKGLQRLLAYMALNMPASTFTGAITATSAVLSGALSALTVTGKPVVTTASADGALTIADGVVKITKAGVCAMTLAAPTAGQEGTVMRIVSNTANAHTLTATGLIDDGVTGGSKNLGTFGAFAGASITLVAINLKWSVLSKNVVTIS